MENRPEFLGTRRRGQSLPNPDPTIRRFTEHSDARFLCPSVCDVYSIWNKSSTRPTTLHTDRINGDRGELGSYHEQRGLS